MRRIQRTCNVLLNKCIIETDTGTVFGSFRDRDLKDTGSCDEPGAGTPLVPVAQGGTTRESFEGEGANIKKTYTTRRPLCPKH